MATITSDYHCAVAPNVNWPLGGWDKSQMASRISSNFSLSGSLQGQQPRVQQGNHREVQGETTRLPSVFSSLCRHSVPCRKHHVLHPDAACAFPNQKTFYFVFLAEAPWQNCDWGHIHLNFWPCSADLHSIHIASSTTQKSTISGRGQNRDHLFHCSKPIATTSPQASVLCKTQCMSV